MSLMEVPWKETAEAVEIDGGWYTMITVKGIRAYFGATSYPGRLQLIFYEDITAAMKYETKEQAEKMAAIANDPQVDTLTKFMRPRRGAELMKKEGQECIRD